MQLHTALCKLNRLCYAPAHNHTSNQLGCIRCWLSALLHQDFVPHTALSLSRHSCADYRWLAKLSKSSSDFKEMWTTSQNTRVTPYLPTVPNFVLSLHEFRLALLFYECCVSFMKNNLCLRKRFAPHSLSLLLEVWWWKDARGPLASSKLTQKRQSHRKSNSDLKTMCCLCPASNDESSLIKVRMCCLCPASKNESSLIKVRMYPTKDVCSGWA